MNRHRLSSTMSIRLTLICFRYGRRYNIGIFIMPNQPDRIFEYKYYAKQEFADITKNTVIVIAFTLSSSHFLAYQIHLTFIISDIINIRSYLISKCIVWAHYLFFIHFNFPVISHYWYLKVNYLGPETLL